MNDSHSTKDNLLIKKLYPGVLLTPINVSAIPGCGPYTGAVFGGYHA